MAKYIDVEKVEALKTMINGLLQEFIDEYKIYSTSSIDYHGGRAEGVETARTMILRRLNTLLEQPTADVVEVKHGEWEKTKVVNEEYGYVEVYYQHKDCKISPAELYKCPFEHCPRCGAKMDGK